MECSSTTLWADHRLAVEQSYFLTPKNRFPYSFLLISLISIQMLFIAVFAHHAWPDRLFSISLFMMLLVTIQISVMMMSNSRAIHSYAPYQNNPGRERMSQENTGRDKVAKE